ncbi:cold shock domain-containing protein [Aeromicrobium sp. Leaf350]|uniref:cold shock domain-containing protein n=1 Tax=Aeromicrobium sp. Leaf350 TaxID=2876565 RepID=UPI001E61E695|nr:cold shock domain-containing protein [Aeromicrobium sp. Leaf350]
MRTYERLDYRGSVAADDGGPDLYFTPGSIVGTDSKDTEVGVRVQFDVLRSGGGFVAENIRRL